MTLPDERVLDLLRDDFVVGWRNIEQETYCGSSSGYAPGQTAVGTTNGAGAHNVQLFVLAPDGVVLHALPGFWHPDDLVAELRFAQVVDRLYRDEARPFAEKLRMFERLHRSHVARASAATVARSAWQGFDAAAERKRAEREPRDTMLGAAAMKPVNVLVHERMAARPFVPFADFDVAGFVDYGRKFYDNNAGHDDGRRFRKLEVLMAKRAREAAIAARRAEREARREARRNRRG